MQPFRTTCGYGRSIESLRGGIEAVNSESPAVDTVLAQPTPKKHRFDPNFREHSRISVWNFAPCSGRAQRPELTWPANI